MFHIIYVLPGPNKKKKFWHFNNFKWFLFRTTINLWLADWTMQRVFVVSFHTHTQKGTKKNHHETRSYLEFLPRLVFFFAKAKTNMIRSTCSNQIDSIRLDRLNLEISHVFNKTKKERNYYKLTRKDSFKGHMERYMEKLWLLDVRIWLCHSHPSTSQHLFP